MDIPCLFGRVTAKGIGHIQADIIPLLFVFDLGVRMHRVLCRGICAIPKRPVPENWDLRGLICEFNREIISPLGDVGGEIRDRERCRYVNECDLRRNVVSPAVGRFQLYREVTDSKYLGGILTRAERKGCIISGNVRRVPDPTRWSVRGYVSKVNK